MPSDKDALKELQHKNVIELIEGAEEADWLLPDQQTTLPRQQPGEGTTPPPLLNRLSRVVVQLLQVLVMFTGERSNVVPDFFTLIFTDGDHAMITMILKLLKATENSC